MVESFDVTPSGIASVASTKVNFRTHPPLIEIDRGQKRGSWPP